MPKVPLAEIDESELQDRTPDASVFEDEPLEEDDVVTNDEPCAFEVMLDALLRVRDERRRRYPQRFIICRGTRERESMDTCPRCQHYLSAGICPNCGFDRNQRGEQFFDIDLAAMLRHAECCGTMPEPEPKLSVRWDGRRRFGTRHGRT